MASELISFQTLMKTPRLGWPLSDDIESHRVYIDNQVLQEAISTLRKTRRLILIGAEGRGKTVLARTISYQLLRYQIVKEVRVLDLRTLLKEDLANTFRQIQIAAEDRQLLLLIENAHIAFEIAMELVEIAFEKDDILTLLTSRNICHQDDTIGEHEALFSLCSTKLISPDVSVARGVIETYIRSEGLSYVLSPDDIEWIGSEFGISGINLRVLRFYLNTWQETRGSLFDVDRHAVLRFTAKEYLGQVGADAETRRTLFRVAAVCQFDVPYIDFEKEVNISAKLRQLAEIGLIGVTPSSALYNWYVFPHPSDCSWIIEALSAGGDSRRTRVSVAEAISEYIQNKPKNISTLVRNIYNSDQPAILSGLVRTEKQIGVLAQTMTELSVSNMVRVFRCIVHACPEETTKRLWERIKSELGRSKHSEAQGIKDWLKSGHIVQKHFLLQALSKIDEKASEWVIEEGLDVQEEIERLKERGITMQRINLLLPLASESESRQMLALVDIDEMVGDESLKAQHLLWHLIYCLKYKSNHVYLQRLLRKLVETKRLNAILRNCNSYKVWTGLSYNIRKVDLSLGQRVQRIRNAKRWNFVEEFSLAALAKYTYRLRWAFGKRREESLRLLGDLSTVDLTEKLRDRLDGEDDSLKQLGRLLSTCHQICRGRAALILQGVADNFVTQLENIDIRRTPMVHLFMFQKQLQFCSPGAWKRCMAFVLRSLDIEEKIAKIEEFGIGRIILDMSKYDRKSAEGLAERILELDFDSLIQSQPLGLVNELIWCCLELKESDAVSWVNLDNYMTLNGKVRESPVSSAFWFIWNLLRINRACGIKLLESFCAGEWQGDRGEAFGYVLEGLRCSVKTDAIAEGALRWPRFDFVQDLCNNLSFAPLACFSRLLKAKELEALNRFVSMYLYLFDKKFLLESFKEGKKGINVSRSEDHLFCDIDLREEPDTTFEEIRRTLEQYSGKNRRTYATVSELSRHLSMTVMPSTDLARKWIVEAIDRGAILVMRAAETVELSKRRVLVP